LSIDLASEFNYKKIKYKNDLFVYISQSGETADTLKVLKFAKQKKIKNLVISNAEHSSMQELSDYFINISAGPEIGVASTKAFTAQLLILNLIAIKTSYEKGISPKEKYLENCNNLITLASMMSEILDNVVEFEKTSKKLSQVKNIIYLGKSQLYPIALEGSLKLKEISYIPSQAYAAGELKHGPIALIDKNVYIIALVVDDENMSKIISNLEEVKAREGNLVVITNNNCLKHLSHLTNDIIILQNSHNFVAPILYTIPVQLLAYFVALYKGTDIDQPRNLAKSVTVE